MDVVEKSVTKVTIHKLVDQVNMSYEPKFLRIQYYNKIVFL